MLIQLPSGSPEPQGPQNAEQSSTTFEAGLRRDLASSPIVSYDSMLGGVAKRAIDLTVSVLTAPAWIPLMLAAASVAKLRDRSPVFVSHERVGYGGHSFKCFALRISPASEADEVANDPKKANSLGAKVGGALERLPQLFNVIRGEMALVGPSPLTREQLEPMKSARRYYLSARPGVVGISTIIGGSGDPSQYKIYAMSWALTTDALIFWDGLRSIFDRREELWNPSFKRAEPKQSTSGIVVRRRSEP
ncbi:MAG: sugar transferase [Alphaproteobacteria bacterium]|nr:sugar transferase [Alphaproteobacteria bacterium]